MLLGDVGFDEREILRDASNLDDTLYKNQDISTAPIDDHEKTLGNHSTSLEKSMDVDMEAPITDDGFGAVGDGFMGTIYKFA